MSAHGCVNLAFGDGRYDFNISPIGVALELQDKCGGVGIGTIWKRLHNGTFFINDFRETIRLARIGAGAKPVDALKLVERYVDARPDSTDTKPWSEAALLATAIIDAALVGVPAESVGKKDAADQTANEAPTTTGVLSDPPSTESAQPSDLIPAK